MFNGGNFGNNGGWPGDAYAHQVSYAIVEEAAAESSLAFDDLDVTALDKEGLSPSRSADPRTGRLPLRKSGGLDSQPHCIRKTPQSPRATPRPRQQQASGARWMSSASLVSLVICLRTYSRTWRTEMRPYFKSKGFFRNRQIASRREFVLVSESKKSIVHHFHQSKQKSSSSQSHSSVPSNFAL
jgi:hypothetical protein